MKVVYDISVLGLNYRSGYGRAGIFRSVEAVAEGLGGSAECELVFSAAYSIQALQGADEYLRTNPRLEGVPLSYPPVLRRVGRLFASTGTGESGTGGDATGAAGGMAARAVATLGRLKRLVERNYPMVRGGTLAEADIFHSPLFELPRQVKQARGLARFLTVHDLVPLLMPQLSTPAQAHVKRAVDSLVPDDWAICVSEATKRDLCEYRNLDLARVFVIYWAASPELFYPCADEELKAQVRRKYAISDAPYLLSLNTLEPRKNVETAIRAFARLVEQEKVGDLHLVLAGAKGWNYSGIYDLLGSNPRLRDRVTITGYVDDADLAPLYSGALAFVFPSLYEGFGLPPLEAMQCGVPVITSNASSLPEVVDDAGIMVDPTDTDALAQAMLDVHADSTLRAELSRKSVERARLFSWGRCVGETLAAYRVGLHNRG